MINTSNEYKQLIRKNRTFLPKASLILADNTVLNLVPADIMQGGIKIDDSVGEKVSLGTAIINKCTLTLNNFSGKFDSYNFAGAVARPQIGLQLSNSIEYLAKGVFAANRPTVAGSIIVLEALDNMALFDTEFSAVSISFPCTALQLLQSVCLHCGVSLSTVNFRNSTYIVESRPDDESISCREIVSWIAQIAGCFARCNAQGALELRWFDFEALETGDNINGGTFDSSTPFSSGDNVNGGNFSDYNSGDNADGGTFADMQRYHHLFSFNGEPTIGTDDIYITGIQVTDTSESPTTVLFGSVGYVLPITDNKLIQNASQAAAIANSVGQAIVGMRFRSFSGNVQSDPAMEAGDVAWVSTRKGNSYPILFTSLGFALGNSETVSCGAETPAQANYRPTPEMKAIVEARKTAHQQISAYDLAVQQLTNLITNGFGLFKTEVEDSNGGIIYYMHDKQVMDESLYRWFMTSGGMIEQKKVDGAWTTVSAVDNEGNALYNVITARGIVADWIRTGSLVSQNGKSAINLDDGTFNLGGGKLIWNGINLVMTGEVNADSGQIGPFALNDRGLFGQLIEIYEDAGYPFMWFTKPGDSGWGSNNSGRANFEPSAMVVRDIKNGIETDISVIARDDTQGTTGKVQITRSSLSSGNIISRATLKSNGLTVDNYENGVFNYSIELNENGLNIAHNNFGGNIFVFEDDTYVSGIGIRALYNKVIAIEQKLAQHGIT